MTNSRKMTLATVAAAALTAQSHGLAAQGVDTLETRVQALEAEASEGPFGLPANFEIYGYVKGDLIFDFDSDLGNTIFGLGSLTPGNATGSNFRGHAFQSRLGFRSTTPTSYGDLTIRLEGDLFGDGGGTFRLRHAYGALGNVLVGQTWTNFMPIESYPATVDFQGPAGIPFARLMQARYTLPFGDDFSASVSIEDPAGTSSDPAYTAAVSYTGERFFLKAAAVYTQVDFNGASFDGYGINLSGNAQLWEGGSVQAQYTTGEAISSYMVFGGDDVATIGGTDTAIDTSGYTFGLSQDFGEQWRAGVVYGKRENDQGNAGDTRSLETVHLNLSFMPTERATFAVEYIDGTREIFGGGSANASRLQTSAQFNF